MQVFSIDLSVHTSGDSGNVATLTVYIPDNKCALKDKRPAVVVLPGGGYAHLADHEGEPVALRFVGEGACAAVLRYSCTPARFPQALCEALTAIRYLRDRAEEFGIDPKNIAILGFSAGGQLCGCTGTVWNLPVLTPYLGEDKTPYRPDKMILCYPVLSNEGPHHQGSFDCLLGDENELQTAENRKKTCLEYQVGPHTPPAYLWHTFEDTGVPPIGTIKFARAMKAHNRIFELHIYPHGGHGNSMGNHVVRDRDFNDPMQLNDWVHGAVRFLFDKDLGE